MNIKNILVPLDSSENSLSSLKHASDLANQCKASVIGLHVITNMSLFTAVHAMIVSEDKWPNDIRDFMKDAKRVVTKEAIPYKGVVIGGENAGSDIVTFANSPSNAIDLIVMSRKGSNFFKEAILGSTVNFVLHTSKTPLLVIE